MLDCRTNLKEKQEKPIEFFTHIHTTLNICVCFRKTFDDDNDMIPSKIEVCWHIDKWVEGILWIK